VRAFPGTDVEPVSDSSRYFVLKLEDTSGNAPGVGLPVLQHWIYVYRQVNMHLLVWGSLTEVMRLILMLHFKIISSQLTMISVLLYGNDNRWVKQSKELVKEQQNPTPSKDYSLKQGEKIKINLGALKVICYAQFYKAFIYIAWYPFMFLIWRHFHNDFGVLNIIMLR